MEISASLFYILAATLVFFSLAVILAKNPVHSALYLAVTMVVLAFVFFMLNAPFIAGVQLIVYAGAVIVLFTMVIMLFDLKREKEAFSKGALSGFLKIASAGAICGFLFPSILFSVSLINSPEQTTEASTATTQQLAQLLFSKYVFAFEALGLLLLLIAIGAVSVSRIKGGTHAK